jgi:branched-chain amino acid transport system ATP-binding protein
MHMLLEVKDLNTFYGESHVLQGISLNVAKGELVALLGRKGMGNGTTLKTIMGLVKSKSGSVIFEGKDITGFPPFKAAQAGLGYVPEERRIFPELSVHDNLLLGIKGGKIKNPDDPNVWTTDRIYGHFPKLGERCNSQGRFLSGGEQQMLSIGRALMTHPELIILDEATEGLAPLIVNEIWNVIADIRDSGIATLIVDRDYRRVLAHSDQAIVLQKGLLELSGPYEQVALDPALPKLLGV